MFIVEQGVGLSNEFDIAGCAKWILELVGAVESAFEWPSMSVMVLEIGRIQMLNAAI